MISPNQLSMTRKFDKLKNKEMLDKVINSPTVASKVVFNFTAKCWVSVFVIRHEMRRATQPPVDGGV